MANVFAMLLMMMIRALVVFIYTVITNISMRFLDDCYLLHRSSMYLRLRQCNAAEVAVVRLDFVWR